MSHLKDPVNHLELLEAIANRWAGEGMPRRVGRDRRYHFGNEDGFRYVAEVRRTGVYVLCLNDTPDAWFWVGLDGWHTPDYGSDRRPVNVFTGEVKR